MLGQMAFTWALNVFHILNQTFLDNNNVIFSIFRAAQKHLLTLINED